MKRPFLLLELLIAFSLVSLFAFPLIFNPLNKLNNELTKLEEMERERYSELLLADIKERLYLNEIPWKKIPSKKPETKPTLEPTKEEYTFYLGDPKKGKKRTISFDIYLYWDEKPKNDNDGREFGILCCDFHSQDKKKETIYHHKIFLFSYGNAAQL